MVDNVQGKRPNRERSHVIDIDSVTKRHLMFFMKQELDYYNTMVNNATMRLRAFPDEILGLKDGYERLWSNLAYNGRSIRELAKLELKKWPRELRTSVPQSATKNGKLALDERKLMMLDIAGTKGNIHPQMRRTLAAELLRSMMPQAEQLANAQRNSAGTMRSPVHMLTPLEYPEKRHLQLSSDIPSMVWDPENKRTEITVPYTDKPLIVRDFNLTDEKFDIMIIRQQPNVEVTDSTPWQIALMHTSHRYLLDLTDQSLHVRRKRAA